MTRPINLVFDLDDTLFNAMPVFIEDLNAATGLNVNHAEVSVRNFPFYGLSTPELRRVWLECKSLERMEWIGNSANWLTHCLDFKGYASANIVYCTARAWHAQGESVTRQRLVEIVGEHDFQLVLTDHGENKADALVKAGIMPSLFVDDNVLDVVSVARRFEDCTSLLYTQRWNTQADYPYRVDSMDGILNACKRRLRLARYAEA